MAQSVQSQVAVIQKSLFLFLRNLALNSSVYRVVIIFVSILFLSKSVTANLGQAGVKIGVPLTATSSNNNLSSSEQEAYSQKATLAIQQGLELYQQNTAESLKLAIEKFQAALPLWRAIGNQGQAAATLNNIGKVYSDLGETEIALDFFNQALNLRQELVDSPSSDRHVSRVGVAIVLNNIGKVYSDLGDKQKALEYYNQALSILDAVGDIKGKATALNNIAAIYSDLGDKQKALEVFNQALPLRRLLSNSPNTDTYAARIGEATTLNNIAAVYNALGDKEKALDYYNQALYPLSFANDTKGKAITINNIANVYKELGKRQNALDYYNQVLSLIRSLGDEQGEAETLHNIADTYNELGQKQAALEFYNQALPLIRSTSDKKAELTTLNHIADIYKALGQEQAALEFYHQALTLNRSLENTSESDRLQEVATLNSIALVERNRNNFNEALNQTNAAIKIIENLSPKLSNENQQLRKSYLVSLQDNYKLKIDLLMQLHKNNPSQGYEAEALQTSEQAKILNLYASSETDIISAINPNFIPLGNSLNKQENSKEQLNPITAEISSLVAKNQALQAQIQKDNSSYAALTQQQIQQQILDDKTLVLSYSLGEERSYLWAITKNNINSYELPKQTEIETAVKNFYAQISNTTANNSNLSQTTNILNQLLIQPVVSELDNKRLIIVGDGILKYLPFSALKLPGKLEQNNQLIALSLQKEAVNLPATSAIASSSREALP